MDRADPGHNQAAPAGGKSRSGGIQTVSEDLETIDAAVRAIPIQGARLPDAVLAQTGREDQNRALATTPVEELLALEFLAADKITDPLQAYQLSKRGNALHVAAEAVRWGRRGPRINCISPGIIMTPLARDELNGPRGEGYRRTIDGSAAGRAGTPDEVGGVGALLMGSDGGFITGSDFLMDGGVTAAWWYGDLGLDTWGPAYRLCAICSNRPLP